MPARYKFQSDARSLYISTHLGNVAQNAAGFTSSPVLYYLSLHSTEHFAFISVSFASTAAFAWCVSTHTPLLYRLSPLLCYFDWSFERLAFRWWQIISKPVLLMAMPFGIFEHRDYAHARTQTCDMRVPATLPSIDCFADYAFPLQRARGAFPSTSLHISLLTWGREMPIDNNIIDIVIMPHQRGETTAFCLVAYFSSLFRLMHFVSDDASIFSRQSRRCRRSHFDGAHYHELRFPCATLNTLPTSVDHQLVSSYVRYAEPKFSGFAIYICFPHISVSMDFDII